MTDPVVSSQWASVRDHSRDFEHFTYVYPVISRRSRGLSIGLNLNPDKVCNFDCVYCCVDRRVPPRTRELDLTVLADELDQMIRLAHSGDLARHPRFAEGAPLTRVVRDLAFSGDGEPTMVPDFEACVRVAVEAKRAHGLDATKIVLITDAAGLDKGTVRRGLELMDAHQGEIWGKLDAGTEPYFRSVNRSHIRFDRILRNLTLTAQVRPIIIQTMFLRIRGEMMSDGELSAYCGRLREIVAGGGKIRAVHAYTVARPTPEAWATRLTPGELEALAGRVREQTGLPVETFA